MEQTRSGRKAISLDAVIGCARFGLIRGRIIEFGLNALYIKAETSIVPIGAEVTVTFQPGDGVCSDCLSVTGRVTHQSRQGFGVELDPPGPRCREFLQRNLPVARRRARMKTAAQVRAV
jgi:hypothetical protein